MRKSFIIYKDSLSVLDELTNEQAGIIFKAIKDFQNGNNVELDFAMKMVFLPFKNQFIRDNENYKKKSEINTVNGSIGGKRKVANASERKKRVAILPDNDSVSDNDSVNDTKGKFIPPTIEEVKIYLKEKKISDVEHWAEKFWGHYESNGWMVGKNKMKSWKASVSTWDMPKSKEAKTETPQERAARLRFENDGIRA